MKLVFDVHNPGDSAAGISPYTDQVTVELASDNPGGESGEFEEYIRGSIAEWFDGAKVQLAPTIPEEEVNLAKIRLQSIDTLASKIDFSLSFWRDTPAGEQYERLMAAQMDYERKFNL